MDTSVIAALISGTIAILGVFASIITARWQVNLQKKELDLKARELETATEQLLSEVEALRQTQFTEILKGRLEVYPSVWTGVIQYTLHWETENKTRDQEWAQKFLDQLTTCNAEAGVFFSQAVYEKFNELRNALIRIKNKLEAGEQLDKWELKLPDRIFVGENHEGGLATFLKDDLGSYRDAVIQARNNLSKNGKQNLSRDKEDTYTELGTMDVVPEEYINEQNKNRRNSYASIAVLSSDDSKMIGKIFELEKIYTTIGRKASNDIIFAKDTPVSRYHAAIEFLDGQFYICELSSEPIETNGNAMLPIYGTYVNNKRINGSVLLRNGDKITLGKRVQLRFEFISR